MSFDIDQSVLDEINIFVNKGTLVHFMSNADLSFEAMAFILQTLRNGVDAAQAALDKNN